MAGRPWEPWEEAMIATGARAPIPGLHRSANAVKVQRRRLGIQAPPRLDGPPWTPGEDALLRSGERIPAGLEHRSPNGIKLRRRRLGIPQPRHPYRLWTPGEDAQIREAMARPDRERDWPALAVKLGRSSGATRTRGWTLRRRAE